MPRLITENIRSNLNDPKYRAIALRREANRIGAKLDGLLHGRPTSSGSKVTSLVLDAARSLIAKNSKTNASELAMLLKSKVKRQSLDKHIAVLIRDGFLSQQMQVMRKGLKRKIRMLTRGPRFDEPFVLWMPTSSAKTVNKVRALVRRIYDLGIRHRMFRENKVLATVRRTAQCC